MSEPIIDLKEGRYYLGIWYVDLPIEMTKYQKGGNYLCTAYRENDQWTVTFRIRWYNEPEDEFAVTNLPIEDMDEAQIAHKLDRMVHQIAAAVEVKEVEFFSIRGGGPEFMAEAQRTKPRWLHVMNAP